MSSTLRIGLIGLDTSHAPAFVRLLNNPSEPHHVSGGRIAAAFPGGSPDLEISASRIEKFTAQIRDEFKIPLTSSAAEVAEMCDALIIASVDGRVHRAQFQEVAPFGKPTFIDKPFAVSFADARAILDTTARHKVKLMTCSSLRYSQPLTQKLADSEHGPIFGADFYGPMPLQPTQPGLFWYGIHSIEMLYATLGEGCRQVTAVSNADHEMVTGVWADGRIGTVRGNRKGNKAFGGLIHREKATQAIDTGTGKRSDFACLLDQIVGMFAGGAEPISSAESLEIVRFIEAANASRESGKTVLL